MKRSRWAGAVVVVALSVLGLLQDRDGTEAVRAEVKGTPNVESIVVGEVLELDSTVLGETRRLRVAVPEFYADADWRCSVLYLLDGESLFFQAVGCTRHLGEFEAPPLIVVGIENTERTRDLTPPTTDPDGLTNFPTGGGSADFRRFLLEEVRPLIEGRYRTNGIDLLAGHSFGGLFAAETLLIAPQAFDAFLILSPSLWWDGASLVDRFREVAPDHGLFERFAWFSMGDEGAGMNPHFEAVTWELRDRAHAGFRWDRGHFPDHDHWAAALPALNAGLRAYFEPIRTLGSEARSFAEVERDLAHVQRSFGDAVELSAGPIVRRVRELSASGEIDAAVEILDGAIAALPLEPLLPYVKAEVLAGADQLAAAIEVLERAVENYSGEARFEVPLTYLNRQLEDLRGRLNADDAPDGQSNASNGEG